MSDGDAHPPRGGPARAGGPPELRVMDGGRAPPPPLPHDLEAETQVLGAVILRAGALAEVADVVRAGDFYHPGNGLLFQVMEALAARGEAIDAVTLAAELRARGRLDAVGGVKRLGELTDLVATAAHAAAHARVVAALARVRRLATAAEDVAALARAPEAYDAPAYFKRAAEHLTPALDAAAPGRDGRGAATLGACLEEFGAKLERARARPGGGPVGCATGLRALDALLQGHHPGELTLIAARPAMGKTAIALQGAAATARRDGPALFISLEMPRDLLAGRLACAAARVELQRVRAGDLDADARARLAAAFNALDGLPLHVDDDPRDATLAGICARIRRAHREHGIVLAVLDYLQLLAGAGDEETRERVVSEISRGLKLLAGELGIPIVALSQLNRGPEQRSNHRPLPSDLRESGSLEQDADTIVFVYRDEVYDKQSVDAGIAELIVAKQRNGPTDTVRARFVKELTLFEDLDEDAGAAAAAEAW